MSQHRSSFTLASKCGMQGVDVAGDGKLVRVIDGRPETIRATCEAACKRLQTDVIDLYYLHRWDKQVPIEDSVGALADLVRAGKIRSHRPERSVGRHPAQRPCRAPDRRRADRVFAVDAQPRDCRAAGLPRTRRGFCRLQPGGARLPVRRAAGREHASTPRTSAAACRALRPSNYAANLKLLPAYQAIAQEVGCTPAQLALAWLLHQGDDIIPIPGTTSVEHLQDDLGAVDVKLGADVHGPAGRPDQPAHRGGQPLQRAGQPRGRHRSVLTRVVMA